MEGFLEANRIVEVSLTKLNGIHKTGDLPLRRTLLVSKVLNTAQEVATSAHLSFIRSPPSNSTRSSKLLASISQESEQYSSDESRLPTGLARSVRTQTRLTSPIASAVLSRQEPPQVSEDESMDFVNVSSVLSNILCDSETTSTKDARSPDLSLLISSDMKRTHTETNTLFDTNSDTWSAWQFDLNNDLTNHWTQSTTEQSSCPKLSGKRNHIDAFPVTDKENSLSWNQLVPEEPKRFKPSTPEGCPLESLPGFCGYLSPKNLQTAPLITYMFGSGFAQPSSQHESLNHGWPGDHFATSSSPTQPILAY